MTSGQWGQRTQGSFLFSRGQSSKVCMEVQNNNSPCPLSHTGKIRGNLETRVNFGRCCRSSSSYFRRTCRRILDSAAAGSTTDGQGTSSTASPPLHHPLDPSPVAHACPGSALSERACLGCAGPLARTVLGSYLARPAQPSSKPALA